MPTNKLDNHLKNPTDIPVYNVDCDPCKLKPRSSSTEHLLDTFRQLNIQSSPSPVLVFSPDPVSTPAPKRLPPVHRSRPSATTTYGSVGFFNSLNAQLAAVKISEIHRP